jgi:hypothetical protein
MLLSRANLDRLEEEPKLDRIKLYVQDQKDRLPYYKSPGSVSVPESCINDGSDNDEALSASISEIERRKYRSSMHHNSRIEFSPLEIAVESKLNNNQNVKRTRNSHRREKDEQEKDSCASQLVRKRKRMKPDTTSEVRTASSSKLLPQSKSKGFHLLQVK